MPEQKLIFRNKPQINISTPSTARMWLVCAVAFFTVLQSSLGDNGQSLVTALTAFFTAVVIELFTSNGRAKLDNILNGSSVTTALVLSLMLPNQLHPVYAVFGTIFAIVVIKYSFGGLGSNWFNPALGGWLFIRISWQKPFEEALEGSLYSSTEMVLSSNVSAIDNSVTSFFNSTVFSFSDVQLHSGYIDLLFLNNPAIIADRGIFALLIGTLVITALGINRGWIPLVYLAVYGFLIRFAGDVSGLLWNGDLLFGLFSGGTLATAFILAAEPSSAAKSKTGVVIVVVLAAVLSWFFRYKCMEFAGSFIALAFVNCLTPLVRLFEEKYLFVCNSRTVASENIL